MRVNHAFSLRQCSDLEKMVRNGFAVRQICVEFRGDAAPRLRSFRRGDFDALCRAFANVGTSIKKEPANDDANALLADLLHEDLFFLSNFGHGIRVAGATGYEICQIMTGAGHNVSRIGFATVSSRSDFMVDVSGG